MGRSLKQSKSGGAVFLLFLLGVVLTLGLYFVKTWVQTAKAEARTLEVELKAEQEVVSILKSELAHLESPARLEDMAADILGLEPVRVEQFIRLEEIEDRFPIRVPKDREVAQ